MSNTIRGVKKQTVERGLDAMIVRIMANPSERHFEIMKEALDEVTRQGYNVREYYEIHAELRQEYLGDVHIPEARRAEDIDLSDYEV